MTTALLPASGSRSATRPVPPAIFAAAWTLLAASGGVLLAVLWQAWQALPEMNDRFLIPLAAAWLVKRNAARWRSTPARPSRWGLAAIAFAAVLAPPAWLLLVQVGPRVLLLWWLSAALALAAVGLSIVQFGWRRTGVNLFPIAFCFLSLPTPHRLQQPLQMHLKEYTTAATAAVLPAIGIPAERRGHTLVLPSGQLGVVDACSGVRSVTALTAIAIFVAYLRSFSFVRGALLVAATLGIVVVSNTLRVVVTGILQETIGPQFAHGRAHDVLGYLVILTGLVLIVGVSALLARWSPERTREFQPAPAGPLPRGGMAALTAIALSLAGCLWSEQFRTQDRDRVDLSRLPKTLTGWQGEDRDVPEAVADTLKCDQMVHRVYVSELGREATVYLMYWATPASAANMHHHPDICMPLQGWSTEVSRLSPVEYRGGKSPLPASHRVYSQGSQRQLVYYWSQAGPVLMPDGKEDPNQIREYQWVFDVLLGRAAPERTSRLSVRVDMELTGDETRQTQVLADFAGVVAREVYTLLPWATPEN